MFIRLRGFNQRVNDAKQSPRLFHEKWFSRNHFSKFSCVCLSLDKLVNGKHFPVKEKFGLIFRKVFSFYFGRKHFPKIVKNLEMSYYLLTISNLILKLLITIYFVLIFFFIFIPQNLIFILTLVLNFMIFICFFLIIFLIKIFYLSNLVHILLIVTYFI